MAMQATSQLWSRAGNFNDGCGEGHIYTLPNMTWLSPPGWASEMIFTTFQPHALAVGMGGEGLRGCVCPGPSCVDVFAAASVSGDHVTLRLVNSGNTSRTLNVQFVGTGAGRNGSKGSAGFRAQIKAQLLSLTSPLSANQTAYKLAKGGVNPIGDPLLISTQRASVNFTNMWVLPPQSFQILLVVAQ